ncbi:MAG: chemotaxis protein CheC [Candidatus Aureabacteria bacterium]|nr:chemotaxis protein CheC [Candidatus Auribacterota bacterium]
MVEKKELSIDVTPEQVDILTELINIGMGRAASSLNNLLDSFITLQIPKIWVFSTASAPEELQKFGNTPLFVVKQFFNGAFSGKVALLFPPESAETLVCSVTDEDKNSPNFKELKFATLCEIGNILINGVIGSICNVLEEQVEFTLPEHQECPFPILFSQFVLGSTTNVILMAKTCFIIEELKIEGHLLLALDNKTFCNLMSGIDALEKKENGGI